MKSQEVEQLKEKGNAALKKGNSAEAMLHYTHAIRLDPNNHVLYSNRSLAFLKLDQHYLALQDALQTIKLQPNWPKGFYRKGEVEMKAGHYAMALMSYKQALLLDPTSETLKSAISATQKELAKEKKLVVRQPIIFAAGGAGIGLLIVLADHFLTHSPAVKHPVLQVLLMSAFAALGFGISKAYRYLIVSQTSSLLDPPVDLLAEIRGDDTAFEDVPSAADRLPTTTTSQRKGGTAAGRQRYRKSKN